MNTDDLFVGARINGLLASGWIGYSIILIAIP